MSDDPVISLENVSFFYGSEPVLQDVSFKVNAFELNYIVGPNGGGKTTLLKIILGLLQPFPGVVRVFGMPPKEVRQRIGYTPQIFQFDRQFPVTVMDVVLMGCLGARLGGRYSKADRKAALAALDEMGMVDKRCHSFSTLSGGQQQRVLIARSLASNPELLLLDEPTANVDIQTEDRLFRIIEKLNKRMTILMVSHDKGFTSDQVKSVICVNRRVDVHPTCDITDDAIQNVYGNHVRLIRHDLSVKG